MEDIGNPENEVKEAFDRRKDMVSTCRNMLRAD